MPRRRELHEDDAEDEQQARAAHEGRRLIDPELRDRGSEEGSPTTNALVGSA
jgi:hypothetical protein